jgi:recombination protein RecA
LQAGRLVGESKTKIESSVAALRLQIEATLADRIPFALTPASQPASSYQGNLALPEKYLASPAAQRGPHGGRFGPHPRSETKGLSDGVSD